METFENSPALQRGEPGAFMEPSPGGTAEPSGARKPAEGSPQGTRGSAWPPFCRPSRDFALLMPHDPALKCWAILGVFQEPAFVNQPDRRDDFGRRREVSSKNPHGPRHASRYVIHATR